MLPIVSDVLWKMVHGVPDQSYARRDPTNLLFMDCLNKVISDRCFFSAPPGTDSET